MSKSIGYKGIKNVFKYNSSHRIYVRNITILSNILITGISIIGNIGRYIIMNNYCYNKVDGQEWLKHK